MSFSKVVVFLAVVSVAIAANFCPEPDKFPPITCPSDGDFSVIGEVKIACSKKYFDCDEGEATLQTCKRGMVFDPVRQTCAKIADLPYCDPTLPAPQPAEDFGCPADGQYPASEVRVPCDVLYNECRSGKPYLQSCLKGQVFDPLQGNCADPSLYYCTLPPEASADNSTAPTDATPSGSNGTAPVDSTCAVPAFPFSCPVSDGNFPLEAANPQVACSPSHFLCIQNRAYLKTCYDGRVFDPITRQCEMRRSSYCLPESDPLNAAHPVAPCSFQCRSDGKFPALPMGSLTCSAHYNQCYKKAPYIQTCLGGAIFDPFKKTCTSTPGSYCAK